MNKVITSKLFYDELVENLSEFKQSTCGYLIHCDLNCLECNKYTFNECNKYAIECIQKACDAIRGCEKWKEVIEE